MRTEIDHQYKWGFVLSEQELRRIVQCAQEHAVKIGTRAANKITAKLEDGSLIETESIDDVLTLENGGQKAVTRLMLLWDDGQERPKSSINVQFEDGAANPKGWDSISISVIGESRADVFIAAAELEDRVKKTRTRAWAYLFGRPWFFMVPFFFAIILISVTSNYFSPATFAVDRLEQEYTAGRVSDPIEALILLERLKASPTIGRRMATFAVPFFTPFLVFLALAYLLPKIISSYVFYWGDVMARYDKRLNIIKVFWIIIVLGILASVIGGLILREFL